jgi:hypothetical protein
VRVRGGKGVLNGTPFLVFVATLVSREVSEIAVAGEISCC